MHVYIINVSAYVVINEAHRLPIRGVSSFIINLRRFCDEEKNEIFCTAISATIIILYIILLCAARREPRDKQAYGRRRDVCKSIITIAFRTIVMCVIYTIYTYRQRSICAIHRECSVPGYIYMYIQGSEECSAEEWRLCVFVWG